MTSPVAGNDKHTSRTAWLMFLGCLALLTGRILRRCSFCAHPSVLAYAFPPIGHSLENSASQPEQKPQRFLGWRMVLVAFSVDFVAVGFFFYSYGVFFNAIAKEFGGSHLGASLGLTVTHAVGAVAAPMVGRALDRFPLRRVIAVGAVSMSIGFCCCPR